MRNEGLAHVGECSQVFVHGVYFTVDGPGVEETSSGSVGTRVIMLVSSQLMGCPVEWECQGKAEVARSQLRSNLWCSLINSLA